MKRQEAFIDAKKMLKGGLHCHTTRSDGRGTPEEVLKMHADNGYDFLAVTDHRFYNYANYGESPLIIVPGMELDGSLPGNHTRGVHCHHIVCIGPEKEKGNGFDQDQRFESREFTDPAECQAMLDMIHANSNLTVYCHPEWSGTPAREFDMLRGNFAMEIWNSGCVIEDGLDSDNGRVWDELLIQGQRIYAVATDDGHAMSQHCNGWVMVNSDANIASILDSLENGRFYASCGPVIKDFYVSDGQAHVECSEAVEVQFRHQYVPYHLVQPHEGEGTITSASIQLKKSCGPQYIRAIVKDKQGRKAWTNPIWLDDTDFI